MVYYYYTEVQSLLFFFFPLCPSHCCHESNVKCITVLNWIIVRITIMYRLHLLLSRVPYCDDERAGLNETLK